MNIFQEFSADCQRDDCRIQNKGGTSTLLGWSPAFDRNGNQVAQDPNRYVTVFQCATCGKVCHHVTVNGDSSMEPVGIAPVAT